MEKFNWIYAPKYHHNSNEVVETKYSTREKISEVFIVCRKVKKQVNYLVFQNYSEFYRHMQTVSPADRLFHEVIFGFKNQKIKIDVDGTREKFLHLPVEELDAELLADHPDLRCEDANIYSLWNKVTPVDDFDRKDKVERLIKLAMADAFYTLYGRQLSLDDIVTCESSADDLSKISFHFIVNNYAVESNEEAKIFTDRMMSYLPQAYSQIIDLGVNKSTQNFRIAESVKDGRIKKIKSNHSHGETIITNTENCQLLPVLCKKETKPTEEVEISADDTVRIIEMAKAQADLNASEFRARRGNMFTYRRLDCAHCDLCGREHHSDNTFYVSVSIQANAVYVYRGCWHNTDRRRELIGTYQTAAPQTESKLNYLVDCLSKGKNLFNPHSLFDQLSELQNHTYSQPSLRDFELAHTLCVKAQMKMGKTNALIKLLQTHFAGGVTVPVIRFVSFRQTFSGNIKNRFPDFTLYSDVKGPLTQERLIVQVESLHRISISQGSSAPDLLILDECESIFDQFNSGLLRNFNSSFSVFKWMVKYAKHVVCMDANLSDRTYRILERLRPEFVQRVVYHNNTYQNAYQDQYYFCTDKLKWLGVLYANLDSDEKLAVPMNSLTEAKVLCQSLIKRYPTKKIKLYSSETLQSEKKEHFNNVNLHWSQYDVLIYTPTVSAGVSFEMKHYRKVFGYFTDQSCSVETCIQMIGRIRDVADKQFYLCLSAGANNLPEGVEEIKRFMHTKRENLFRDFDDTHLQYEYGPNGEITYHNTDYFHIWAENVRIRNLSINSFLKRFLHFTHQTGAQCKILTDEIYTENTGEEPNEENEISQTLLEIKNSHVETKREIKAEQIANIANAKELTTEEITAIQDALIAQTEVTEDQKYAYEKHKLRMDYRFGGQITPEFVSRYRDAKIRRIYKNLNRIAGGTFEEVLAQIKEDERANYVYTMSLNEEDQHSDLHRRYVYDQHRIAIGFLKLSGFDSVWDDKTVSFVSIHDSMRANENSLYESINHMAVELQSKRINLEKIVSLRSNRVEYLNNFLKHMNNILFTMYGIRIVPFMGDTDIYTIKTCDLFSVEPDDKKPTLRYQQ